ncbi:MAG: hypothetical protein WCI76_00100 [bacterium]
MKNKTLIRFVESFILLPALTMSGAPVGTTMGPISQAVMNMVNTQPALSLSKVGAPASDALALNETIQKNLELQKVKADAVDAYFNKYDMPLEGTGMKMVTESEKNGLDWRLLPAISVRESTGGKHDCGKTSFNPFGWGSCRIGFKSNNDAIETVARHLSGNDKGTETYYKNKTTLQILHAYNPPSVVRDYAEQVMSIMNDIEGMKITPATPETANKTA